MGAGNGAFAGFPSAVCAWRGSFQTALKWTMQPRKLTVSMTWSFLVLMQ